MFIFQRKHSMVICAVGQVFHAYHASTLRLLATSAPHPADIAVLAAGNRYVYSGCGHEIRAFHLSRQVAFVFREHGDGGGGHDKGSTGVSTKGDVEFIVPFGEYVVSVDRGGRMLVWNIQNREVYLDQKLDPASFRVTTVVHPPTYLNKLLFGSEQGKLKLMNVRTNKVIYEFPGWKSAVKVIESSPAVDLVAVGLASGKIVLHNLKLDETLFTFSQDWGAPTSLAFRNDGPPFLLSGSSDGNIAIWNLETQKLAVQMDKLHKGAVVGLGFLPNEPIFYTSGPDNAVKTWIFDCPDSSGARLLSSLEGHTSPPTRVRFHGSDGEMVLSSGANDATVKMCSTLKMTKRYNLGTARTMDKKKAKKRGIAFETVKLPPITELASDTTRESGWDNVVAIHRDSPAATTWTSRRLRMGSHRLEHGRFGSSPEWRNATATACAVSACGNYGLVGYSTGHIDVYNVQSGKYRWSYVDPTLAVGKRGHAKPVRGVCVDSVNSCTITGCADGLVKFWRFKGAINQTTVTHRRAVLDVGAAVAGMWLHRPNGMLAVACDDYAIVVVDVNCRRVVRRFDEAHTGRIVELAFNPSGHWLVSAAMDACVKVWDLPTSHLIDVLLVEDPCTSISFSPTGHYLATSHVGQLGIYLWLNRSLFSPDVGLAPLGLEFCPVNAVGLPGTYVDTDDRDRLIENSGEQQGESGDQMDLGMEFISSEQIEGLITLSGVPSTHWASLLDMDQIRERNRPKMPAEKPKAAPFFLPTVAGLTPAFDVPEDEESAKKNSIESRVRKMTALEPMTEFGRTLASSTSDDDLAATFDQLKLFGPARIESEIRSIGSIGGLAIGQTLLHKFLTMLQHQFRSNKDFELTQSYLSLFLKLHREDLIGSPEGLEVDFDEFEKFEKELKSIEESASESWTVIDESLNECMCLVQYLRSATV